jgi:2-phospho-L-lactate guanylyltransferase
MVEVVIAARGGPEAKSRCADRLSGADRAELTARMLEDMLRALGQTRGVSRIWVVTPTQDLADLAARHGAAVLRQHEPANLNGGFRLALEVIDRDDAHASLLLLPGDLPLLKPREVEAAIGLLTTHEAVLARSTDGGTGALLFRAKARLAPDFGGASFERHFAQAAKAGYSTAVAQAPSLSRDLDGSEDFAHVLDQAPGSRTAAFLRERLCPIES